MKRFMILSLACAMAFSSMLCSCDATDEQLQGEEPVTIGYIEDVDEVFETQVWVKNFLGDKCDSGMTEIIMAIMDSLKLKVDSVNVARNGADDSQNSLFALTGYGGLRSAPINYQSVDGNGKDITLSGRVFWPYSKMTGLNYPVDNVIIYCHETMFDESSTPSLNENNDFGKLAIDGNLVFVPDYIGFGTTGNLNQTYLCQNLIARNCMDGLLAAISVAGTKNISTLNPGYGTYIMGYSQGGGNAMALHRYIETMATEEQRNIINLKRSFIGSGPYNPSLTFDCWLEEGEMTMPTLLAMVLNGFKAGGKAAFVNYDLKNYFSERFNASGVLEKLANKELGMIKVVGALKDVFSGESERYKTNKSILEYYSLDPIMSDSAKNPNSYCMSILRAALEEENQLRDGWTPQHPISLFYTSGDDMVPAQNTLTAYEKWKDTGMVTKFDCEINQHIIAQIVYMVYAVGCDCYKSDKALGAMPGAFTKLMNDLMKNVNLPM